MRTWNAVKGVTAPVLAAGTHYQRVLAPGVRARLAWLSITLVTANVTGIGIRRLMYPFKSFWWDPSYSMTYIATQQKGLTNHYLFAPGLAKSDAGDQEWRTFPLNARDEQYSNNNIIKGVEFGGTCDVYLQAVVDKLWGTDQIYISWAYKETGQ